MTTFRFDAASHTYYDEHGHARPNITRMLHQCGLIDDRWYTEESCERGRQVHQLTADYDYGALVDVVGCTSAYKGYLFGHIKALGILMPEILEVETPRMHPTHKFGGRPDRVAVALGQRAVIEIKSGCVEKVHGVQTALQAILVAPEWNLPAELVLRLCLYLKAGGKFKIEEHKAASDFIEARRVIAACC